MNRTGKAFCYVGLFVCLFVIVFIILISVPYNNDIDKSTYEPLHKISQQSQKIPKIIHQIWPTAKIPKKFAKIRDHLKKQNPEYRFKLYDDHAMDDFVKTNYPEYYDSYSSISDDYMIAKGDFFRYMIVYHYGGVYFDMKSGHKTPLRDLIKPDDEMIIPTWNNIGLIFPRIDWPAQWVFISIPRHPMLKLVLDEVNSRLKESTKSDYGWWGVFKLTGPLMYLDVVNGNKDQIQNIRYIGQPNGFIYNYMEKNDVDHLSCTLYSSLGIGHCKHKMGKKRYTLKTSPVVKQD